MDKLKIIDANKCFSPDLEPQWIAQAQQGDQQAFHHLYQSYHRRIYALCWRMMADKDSAEDVCQEVFVQLWQKISNFRGESKFSTWLHSVATNIVLGHIRKNKTWIQRIFSIEDQPVKDTMVEMPECSNLDQKIQTLPERARLVFVLFAIEGYRHEEIANMLGMAVGTSKAQYHRARTLLRESLSE
ncbi:MAG: sigma-70 family RNA polymerase sigma factor [Colwellia polaris]|uniref:RNA polymerase sigma factor n=1 Tax=Colwellia polaris TaxID=326537 RepID=UPI0018E99FB5|nr:sigma-70 family RNA polymerase sigma factor [Colwellia polaris]